MEKTRLRVLVGVSIGHAAHDSWFGVTPVLLAALSSQMDLSNADIGLILLLYQGVSSVMQPIFGRLCERIGGRTLAVASILWTTLVFSVAILFPSKTVITICLTLAGFGSGAWHPQGAANATIAGGARWGATAASVFFLGGTLGIAFLGAALGGYLLETFGPQSLLVISLITATIALTVVRGSVPKSLERPEKRREAVSAGADEPSQAAFWGLLIVLLVGIALRSMVYNSVTSYIPKYQEDLGASPASYGLLMSVFLFGVAAGGVLGSYLADRLGLGCVLVVSISLAAVALLAFLRAGGFWSTVLIALSGVFLGPSHTLFVVAGQRRFPTSMGMITGLFLGFTFISGAVGAWLLGLLADSVGLGAALSILPGFALLAALCALVGMRRAQPVPVIGDATSPAESS